MEVCLRFMKEKTMTKRLLALIPLSLMAVALTACQPRMRSMGAAVEPAPIVHRTSADGNNSEMQVDVTGFYAGSNETENVDNVRALGGTASFTYRLGGKASFLFFNASMAGYYGKLNFACTEEDCEDPDDSYYNNYKKWLLSKDGRERYDFVNIQERLLIGMDFNLGRYVILGIAAGAQAFQGGGEYDDMRENLARDTVDVVWESDDSHVTLSSPLVRNADERYGYGALASAWVGTRFGDQGQYGNLTLELSMYFTGFISMWTNSWKFTYAHPSGFYGGVAWGSILNYTIYAGKSFVF